MGTEKVIYNKLVRDKIPDIIRSSGKSCSTEILSNSDYIDALDKKLDEEVAEFHSDKNIEELADILTVVYSLAKSIGYSEASLTAAYERKLHERGGFEDKILLKSVSE